MKNKPKIRFEGFNGNWEKNKLNKLVNFYRGIGLNKDDIDNKGINDCILYGHLYTSYGMITDKVLYKTNEDTKKKFLSKNKDVLIPSSDTTPTGLARATSIEKDGVILGGDINVLRPTSDVDGNFLSLNINSNRDELIKLIKGTTVKHIYNNDIKDIEIGIPNDKNEQIKIGEFYKAVDKFISYHQLQFEELNKLKKVFLYNMFVKDKETIPEIRFGIFNKEWNLQKLYEVASFYRGVGLNKDDIDNRGVNDCILYGHLYTSYGMITDKVLYKTNEDTKKKFLSKNKDVLIPSSDTTPTGLARATSIEKDGVILGGDINVLRPTSDVDGNFLSLNINSNRDELIKLIKGTTVKHIYNNDIKDIVIGIPNDKTEQIIIGKFFKSLDNLITCHQSKLEILKNIKKSLLDKMFV